MGVTRKILSSRQLDRPCIFYTDSLRFDFAETFHFHFKNNRLSFSPAEFGAAARGLFFSYLQWICLGRPRYRDPDDFIQFLSAKLPALSEDDKERAREDELSVELQQQADYVHLHFRSLRLELSIYEFLDFSETITNASRRMRKLDYHFRSPRRIGDRHGSNPRGRVTPGDSNGFWLDQTPESYKSVVYRDGKPELQFPYQSTSDNPPRWYRRVACSCLRMLLKLFF